MQNLKVITQNFEYKLKREMVKEMVNYTKSIDSLIAWEHRSQKMKEYDLFLQGLSYAFNELTSDKIDDTVHYFKLSLLITYKELYNEVRELDYQSILA